MVDIILVSVYAGSNDKMLVMSTWIKNYLSHLETNGRSPATVRAAGADLRRLQAWWEETHDRPFEIGRLTTRDMHHWLRHRQQIDGAKPSTINRGLATVRAYCRWALVSGLLVDNPTAGVPEIVSESVGPASLPDEAIDELLRAAAITPNPIQRRRDEAFMALLVYGGLRIQECCDMQLRDVDLPGGSVVVRRGKGGKARRVPLHSDAQRILQRYLDEVRCPDHQPAVGSQEERAPLLMGRQVASEGRPWLPGVQAQSLRKRLKQLGTAAAEALRAAAERTVDLPRSAALQQMAQQVEQVTPHQLRHSLARRLLKNGATLPEVQRLLGHSRLTTTGMYLQPSAADLRQAIERAGI